jgi:hypothetical protein
LKFNHKIGNNTNTSTSTEEKNIRFTGILYLKGKDLLRYEKNKDCKGSVIRRRNMRREKQGEEDDNIGEGAEKEQEKEDHHFQLHLPLWETHHTQ